MSDKKYILIAEDEALNREIYEDQLSDDYDIKIAKDGKECLLYLKDRMPDAIILDIMMPIMDGFEVCRLIRQDSQYDSVPVLFVSAKASIAEQQEGFAMGANDYLPKPYSEEQIIMSIEKQVLMFSLRTKVNKPSLTA